MLLPIPDGGETVEKVSVGEAARRLGVSVDTIRRRIGKGELTAHQKATPQGFRWEVELELTDQPLNGHDSNILVTTLQAQVQAQAEELDARRREVSELHQLLAQQTALNSGQRRPWWRWWG